MSNTLQQIAQAVGISKKEKKKEKVVKKKLNLSSLKQEQVISSVKEIRLALASKMRNHIGKENAISSVELFEYIYGINPLDINVFQRKFWWDVIKKICKYMRREGDAFVLFTSSSAYVLKTQTEADSFKKRLEIDITSMRATQKLADEWVAKKKWQNL